MYNGFGQFVKNQNYRYCFIIVKATKLVYKKLIKVIKLIFINHSINILCSVEMVIQIVEFEKL